MGSTGREGIWKTVLSHKCGILILWLPVGHWLTLCSAKELKNYDPLMAHSC